MSDEVFELERPYQRPELAALFQEFATALTEGRELAVETNEGVVSIDVPSEVAVELELEVEGEAEGDREGEESADEEDGGENRPQTVEFELELEWEDHSRSSIRVDDAAGEDSDTEGSSENREGSPVEDARSPPQSGPAERRSTFEVYRDNAAQWRWRLVHWNGNIIADSGEGYTTRASAMNGLESVRHNAPTAVVDTLE